MSIANNHAYKKSDKHQYRIAPYLHTPICLRVSSRSLITILSCHTAVKIIVSWNQRWDDQLAIHVPFKKMKTTHIAVFFGRFSENILFKSIIYVPFVLQNLQCVFKGIIFFTFCAAKICKV